MNEPELRRALRGAMATIEAPPPMNGTEVLNAARRAQRTRRAGAAGMVCAAVVALIAAAGSILPDPGAAPAGPPPQTTPAGNPRQAASGRLFDLLVESVPADMDVPTDQRTHQARPVEATGGQEAWLYTARTSVGRDGRWGTLIAEVYTAGNRVPGEGCELQVRWIPGTNCTLVAVGARQVAVRTGDGREFEQVASYRHADGTVVSVIQSRHAWLGPLPSLEAAPLTTPALAALAADPRFHLR